MVSISSEGLAYPEGASTCSRCRLWSFFKVFEFRVEGLVFRWQSDVLVLGEAVGRDLDAGSLSRPSKKSLCKVPT